MRLWGNPLDMARRPRRNLIEEGGLRLTHRTVSWRRWVLVLTLLGVLITACSGASGETFSEIGSSLGGDGGESTVTTAAGSAAVDEGGEEPAEESPTDDSDELGNGGITPVALPLDLGRDIIFTAELTVAVTDVGGAGQQATQAIQGLGGFLFGQSTTGAPEPRSVLTFKVQPEDFQEALARLGEIGEVRSQNVSADDVTERIVDLESRINTAAASVERLRALLAQATDIEAIVELENELLERETELESLRGSLRTLQDQVALATIVLALTEAATRPELDVTMTVYPTHDDGLSCPGDSDLIVEQDTEATICLEITNVGDTSLTDFDVRDPVLDVELRDLIVVFGDPSSPIEPGESLMLAVELVPDRDLRTRTTVTATPLDQDGEEIPGALASSTVSFFVNTADQGGIATFGDGLEASWDLLVSLGQILLLVAGALLPFAWVPLAVWLVWRFWRSRERVDTEPKERAATASE